jgi:DNA-binding transcriptional MocR family regulator
LNRDARIPESAIDAVRGETVCVWATMVALYLHADRSGRCNPSTSTLAKVTGLSERSVLRAIARLESTGVIAQVERSEGIANTYHLRTRDRAVTGQGAEPVTALTPTRDSAVVEPVTGLSPKQEETEQALNTGPRAAEQRGPAGDPCRDIDAKPLRDVTRRFMDRIEKPAAGRGGDHEHAHITPRGR